MHIRNAIKFFGTVPLHDSYQPVVQTANMEDSIYAYVKFYLRTADLLNLRATCRQANNAITKEWVATYQFFTHFSCNISFLYSLQECQEVRQIFNEEISRDVQDYSLSNNQLTFRLAVLNGNTQKALACLHGLSLKDKFNLIIPLLRGLPSSDVYFYDPKGKLRQAILSVVKNAYSYRGNPELFDIKLADKDHNQCIHWVCHLGDVPSLERLFEKHSKSIHLFINAQTISGLTPLHFAAIAGNMEIIKLLVANKAKINMRNNTGITPLNYAAAYGHADAVTYLAEHGAKIELTNYKHRSPLDEAIDKGCVYTVKALFTYGAMMNGNLEAYQGAHNLPLIEAVTSRNQEMVQYIVNQKANIHQLDKDGFTALSAAAQEGCYGIAELLIKHGAYVNHQNNNGFTPLFLAAAFGRIKTCKSLLENRADISISAKLSKMEWLTSSTSLNTKAMKAYLMGKIDKVSINPETIALLNGHQAVYELLKEHRVNVYEKQISFTRWLR